MRVAALALVFALAGAPALATDPADETLEARIARLEARVAALESSRTGEPGGEAMARVDELTERVMLRFFALVRGFKQGEEAR